MYSRDNWSSSLSISVFACQIWHELVSSFTSRSVGLVSRMNELNCVLCNLWICPSLPSEIVKTGILVFLRGVRASHQIPRSDPRRQKVMGKSWVSAVLALDPEFREPTAEIGTSVSLGCSSAEFARSLESRGEFRGGGELGQTWPKAGVQSGWGPKPSLTCYLLPENITFCT